MSTKTDDRTAKAMGALAKALQATEAADTAISDLYDRFPKINKTRVSTLSGSGITKIRNRFERLTTDPAKHKPNLSRQYDPETIAAEDRIIAAIKAETDRWDEADSEARDLLGREHKAVQKAEGELDSIVREFNTALAVLLRDDPGFERKKLLNDSGIGYSLLAQRISRVNEGKADIDSSRDLSLEEAHKVAVQTPRREAKARERLADARMSRKQLVVDLDHASQGHLQVLALADAAGLSAKWTREFLHGQPGRALRPEPRDMSELMAAS